MFVHVGQLVKAMTLVPLLCFVVLLCVWASNWTQLNSICKLELALQNMSVVSSMPAEVINGMLLCCGQYAPWQQHTTLPLAKTGNSSLLMEYDQLCYYTIPAWTCVTIIYLCYWRSCRQNCSQVTKLWGRVMSRVPSAWVRGSKS